MRVRGCCAAAFLAAAIILNASPSARASEEPRSPVKTKLKSTEIPLSWFKSITAAKSVGSSKAPQGFDLQFETLLFARRDAKGAETGGMRSAFLQKSWDRPALKMFCRIEGSRPAELARIEKGINDYYIPFGPAKLPRQMSVTAHLYFPLTNIEAFRTSGSVKYVYLTPCDCPQGEVEIGGTTRKIGLLDRTLNGSPLDPCKEKLQDGDWVLYDENGDGAFDITGLNKESMPLTKAVSIGGSFWAISLAGQELTLKPVNVQSFRIRMDGVKKPCKVIGWSDMTGNFSAEVDDHGFAEIPKDTFQLYSYDCTLGNWSLDGSLRNSGRQKPPSGGEQKVVVGPKLKGQFEKQGEGKNVRFVFKCFGRANEPVNVEKDGKRIAPAFVITRADGSEAARIECPFG